MVGDSEETPSPQSGNPGIADKALQCTELPIGIEQLTLCLSVPYDSVMLGRYLRLVVFCFPLSASRNSCGRRTTEQSGKSMTPSYDI